MADESGHDFGREFEITAGAAARAVGLCCGFHRTPLLDGEAEELTRTAIDLAKGGDTVALRLCMEWLCPPS